MPEQYGSVVVMGVAGCGKTTVGQLLAEESGRPFVDADDFHTAEARMKMAVGVPLVDADRTLWLAQLTAWLEEQNRGGVMACSALKRRHRDVLRRDRGDVVFLHLAVAPEVARSRVSSRPAHYMPVSLVDSQFAALEPLTLDEAGWTTNSAAAPRTIVVQFLCVETGLRSARDTR
jgi:gluconokinase